MATLLSKMHSQRPDPSEYNLRYLDARMEKPGLDPSTVRLALVLLATVTVAVAAILSLAQLVMG